MFDEKTAAGLWLKGYLGALPMLCEIDADAKDIASGISGGLTVKACGETCSFSFSNGVCSIVGDRSFPTKAVFKECSAFRAFLNGSGAARVSGGSKGRALIGAFSKLCAILKNKGGFSNSETAYDKIYYDLRFAVLLSSVAALAEYDKRAKLSAKFMDSGTVAFKFCDSEKAMYINNDEGVLTVADSPKMRIVCGLTFDVSAVAAGIFSGDVDISSSVMSGMAKIDGNADNMVCLIGIASMLKGVFGGAL